MGIAKRAKNERDQAHRGNVEEKETLDPQRDSLPAKKIQGHHKKTPLESRAPVNKKI